MFFFLSVLEPTVIYTLSLHDALPILNHSGQLPSVTISFNLASGVSLGTGLKTVEREAAQVLPSNVAAGRSEEHTSELQSRRDLVCRLLLEKKKTLRY